MEDNRSDVFLIRESIELASLEAVVHVVPDGARAIRYIQDVNDNPEEPCPSLVILDINLPKKPGREVLSSMRHTLRCANVPVVVVTSSDSQRDRDDMDRLGVSGYFRKPSEYDEFMKLGFLVKALLGGTAAVS